MTLDKHTIRGVGGFSRRVLPSIEFDNILKEAGYICTGSAPAKGNRIKVWWNHPTHGIVEAIYDPDKRLAITAYHPN